MKKTAYETPEVRVLAQVKTLDFLSASGDMTGIDAFNDGYGDSF